MPSYNCRVAATKAAAAILRHLDAAGLVAADHTLVADGDYHITLSDDEIAVLEAHGLAVTRGEALLPRDKRADAGSADLATGFVTGYLDGQQVLARVSAIAAAFPSRCSVLTLPFATSGYDGALAGAGGPATVLGLRITADPALRSRPGFLLIGGTHAREWMNPLIALEFAEQLLHNVDPTSSDPAIIATTRLVTEGDIIIVPVMNPDGLTYSIHDDAGWRKNRRPNPGAPGCPGVDDNRNYEVYFGGAGASAMACSDAYHGPSAFSEGDTRNIRWLLEEFPNILVGVDAHSFGRQILRPNPAGGSFIATLPVSPEDEAIYAGLETTLRSAIAAVNGVSYSLGTTSNHAGTSDEYMFFAHRVFGFNTECGTSFQPPWASAVPVIDEMVAGLRALALATLDLALTTPAPLQLVQCIDRTGSMVAFGYDGAARANARRLVDLQSLGDSTGVVSFADPAADPLATPLADRSRVEFPLTLLDDPGDAAAARAAIDAISFGGWTPIGAGLQRAAGMLAGAASPRAILLISDGYENREPAVASVLASWPVDMRVFTVALGPAADAALLQQIATSTGGVFQASPTALDLHLIYNQMRADITDEGLLLNQAIPAGQGEGEYDVLVEPAADWLTITVSGAERRAPKFTLVAPSGRVVAPSDFGVSAKRGAGYAIVRVARPAPGRWRICTGDQQSAHVVGAFVASPLRMCIELPARLKPKAEARAHVQAWFGRELLAPVQARLRSRLLPHVTLPKEQGRTGTPGWSDALPHEALASIGANLKPGALVHWHDERSTLAPGVSRIELAIEGRLPGGAPFQRVALRTIRVG
jgi:hypothetical protein